MRDLFADSMPPVPPLPAGVRLYRGYLSAGQRQALLAAVADIIGKAPLFTPRMPGTGRPFSVRMTNAGVLGWVADRHGYRYTARHPQSGRPWPPMPPMLQRLWAEVAGYRAAPEAALINHYPPGARMGLHVDRDEEALDAPIVSISLGAVARFRLGGRQRRDATMSLELWPGDVLVMGGPARLLHHGIDRIFPDRGEALPEAIGPGRINITLRRVRRPQLANR